MELRELYIGLEVTVGHRKGKVRTIDFDRQAAQLTGAGDAWYAPDAMQYADGRTPGCKFYAYGDDRALAVHDYIRAGGDPQKYRVGFGSSKPGQRWLVRGTWRGPRKEA